MAGRYVARPFKTPYDAPDARRRFEVKRKQYEKLIHDAARGG